MAKEFVVVAQLLSHAQLFVIPGTAARQPPLSYTVSWGLLKFMSVESVKLSNHLILCCLLLLFLQSFPASGSFLISQFFTSSGQSVGVSTLASVLPMNIQNGFLLGLTGLILAVQGILKSLFQHYNSKI